MADLEAAADRALVRVTELKQHVHEAEEALDGLDEATSRLDRRLDEEAEALRAQVHRLQQRAVDERERVDRETDESARALDGVEQSARAAAADCDREAAETRREIAELGESAQGGAGRVVASGRALSTALAHLEQRVNEVEHALATELRNAAEVARSMDVRLREMTQEVQDHTAEVLRVMEGECPELISLAKEDYVKGLDRIDEALTAQLEGYEQPLTATCEEACTVSARAMDENYPDAQHEAALQAVNDLGLAAVAAESELLNIETDLTVQLEGQLGETQAAIDSLDVSMEVLASHGYA